jgi:hypothetical protein
MTQRKENREIWMKNGKVVGQIGKFRIHEEKQRAL